MIIFSKKFSTLKSMKISSLIAFIACAAFSISLSNAGSISPILKERMGALNLKRGLVSGGDKFPILITLKRKVDPLNYYSINDIEIRASSIVNDLMHTASITQQPILEYLKNKYSEVTPLWIENAIAVGDADDALIQWLVDRDDVDIVKSNHPFRAQLGFEPEEILNEFSSSSNKLHGAQNINSNDNANDIEWGVSFVNAPELWKKGVTGKGITVGIADTGIHLEHPAILNKYRGNNNGTMSHDYNWFDAVRKRTSISPEKSSEPNDCPYASPAPCDDHYHGTHCTGTITGEVPNPDASVPKHIGVAYDAKWIGCRNMDHGVGSPALYLGCLQFMLAPTDVNGNNPKSELRPMVVSNSYGCPRSEHCEPDVMKNAVAALRASGVFMAVAAGNEGSGCSTVGAPPGIYAEVFSVGASSYQSQMITYFSSRGPVSVDGSYRTKPDIVAPGQDVLSCAPPSRYIRLSGTSMATPHIAGIVALLWSGNPKLLRNVDATIDIIQKTAKPMVVYDCKSAVGVPNNVYGYGNVDAFAAFSSSNTTIFRGGF